MAAAGSSNSSMNSVNNGMDKGFRFQTEFESPGALRSYVKAQGPLGMIESDMAVLGMKQSLEQFN